LDSTVTTLSSSVTDLSTNHYTLDSTVTTLSSSVTDLSTNHYALDSTVNTHILKTDNCLNEIVSALNGVSAGGLDTTTIDASINALELSLNSLKISDISGLDASLTDYYTKTQIDSSLQQYALATDLLESSIIVDDVFINGNSTIIKTSKGHIYGVGDNGNGQLGLPNAVDYKVPKKINLSNIKKVALGKKT
jgi:hypothetical protein